MKYNPKIHHRRSIRLKEYDYSQAGGYYLTIVTQNRECLFGEILDGKIILNKYGLIVKTIWNDLPNHYNHIKLDKYVIMPNYIHGTMKRHGLPEIVRGFKTFSSRRINQYRKTPAKNCGNAIIGNILSAIKTNWIEFANILSTTHCKDQKSLSATCGWILSSRKESASALRVCCVNMRATVWVLLILTEF